MCFVAELLQGSEWAMYASDAYGSNCSSYCYDCHDDKIFAPYHLADQGRRECRLVLNRRYPVQVGGDLRYLVGCLNS